MTEGEGVGIYNLGNQKYFTIVSSYGIYWSCSVMLMVLDTIALHRYGDRGVEGANQVNKKVGLPTGHNGR